MTFEQRKVVIAGGSGFLGVSLAHHLATRGASVVILSRSAPKVEGPWRHRSWDGRTLGDWRDEVDGATGLVNLAGRSVNCIKTPAHCDEILRSRVESTRVLGQAMRTIDSPPPVWVQMSTAETDERRRSAAGLAGLPVVGFAQPGGGEAMSPYSERATRQIRLDNRTQMPVVVGDRVDALDNR